MRLRESSRSGAIGANSRVNDNADPLVSGRETPARRTLMDIDIEEIRALMAAMAEHQVTGLEIERPGGTVRLTRGTGGGAPIVVAPPAVSAVVATPSAASIPPAASAAAAAADVGQDEAGTTWITSPFVGTYYEAPSPGSPAFVKVGQTIEPGTVLCIVEAMKLMNEIESEIAGTIVEMAGENGKPVEFGDPLFKVKI